MNRRTTSEYGRAPRLYGPADRLVYAVIPQALSARAQLYAASRYSNDGKLALVSALDADPDKPAATARFDAGGRQTGGWRWMSVDETRELLAGDPNWTPED